MEQVYTLKKILDILNISPPKPTVYREEKKGLIPTAKRIKRGSTEVRVWTEDQIPEFGKKYGNIKNENGKTKFISINANKGGTLKTTISFNLARFLALNGLKVLCCGLEVSQKSLTRSLENMREIENISQIDDFEDLTLYDVAENKKSILEVIKKTTLPKVLL